MPVTKLSKLNTQVGFIGLGLMGSRLARRLHAAAGIFEHGTVVHSLQRRLAKGDSHCIIRCGSRADSDVILSSLANDAAVRSVYLDKGGVFSEQNREPSSSK
jgi:3-hydroxyisobutyrate dehydrogenase-like beta-hydroxyacid dehydrogenase